MHHSNTFFNRKSDIGFILYYSQKSKHHQHILL